MKEQDVVEMLRHYRHDWLNDLQLLLGYAQLGKLDRIENKIQHIIERSNQERGLDRLNIPKTMVWLYQLNWRSESFQLEFQSDTNDQSTIVDDELLLTKIQKIFQILPSYQEEFQQYRGQLIFEKVDHLLHIHLIFDQNWTDLDALKEEMDSLSFIDQVMIDNQLEIVWQQD
ncbi:Spo0B domain-containing protein [Gracilibacillus salinarum]|uniref:Spo0B domain-containing protein n=1 Tax=Gracilibacillus salinarum TaxID=2932255 RepID=A0ABY4GPN5_9BACI|nr:Spo0B domain-containing protein [Gracilibacillus salinarum]UOQ86146.1 Spo0B domain-containing protein [Gracilibacillus salinarum]